MQGLVKSFVFCFLCPCLLVLYFGCASFTIRSTGSDSKLCLLLRRKLFLSTLAKEKKDKHAMNASRSLWKLFPDAHNLNSLQECDFHGSV